MADQNQQLADTIERLNSELRLYGELTQATADAVNDAKVGIKGFSAATRMAGGAVEAVGKAATAAAGAMYEGKKGAGAFNDSLTELGKAAEIASVALAAIVPGGAAIKLFVAAIGLATSATLDYIKKSNEMADKLYKGYSGLAKSGAAASDGMTGLYKDAKKLGLSMDEVGNYVQLIGDNSKDLALFSGSAFEGRKRFADMGKAMEPFRKGLIAAGYTQEEINDASMQYLRLQTRIGQSQNMTTQQLAEGARKYLIEQDALAKLTGQSRKEMEDQMEAARSEQRFRAKLEEVRATQGEAAAKRLENANILISSQSKEMGQAFRDTTTGFLGTEAAMKGNMTTQGELMRSTQQLIDGQQNEYEMVTAVGRAGNQFAKDMNMSAQLGTLNDFAIDYAQTLKLGIFTEENKAEAMKKIIEEQKKQGIDGGKAADGITAQYAANIKKQQELNKEMEDSYFKGIANAQSMTTKLANGTSLLTKAFATLTDGVNKLLNILGLGEPEVERAKTKSEIAAAKEVEAAEKEYAESMKNATMMQKLGIGLDDKMAKAKEKLNQAYVKRTEEEQAATAEYERQKKAGNVEQGKIKNSAEYGTKSVAPPAGGGGKAPPAAPNPVITSQEQLSKSGLKIKQGDVQAEESPIDQKIIEMAQQVQSGLGAKFGYFSGFNDKFHQEKASSSSHTTGMAMDFTLNEKPSKQEGKEIIKYLQSLGADLALDEYNEPSSQATAGHFHAQINAYEKGGIAETPQIAFVGEKGPEAMIPLQNGAIPIKFEMPTMPDIAKDGYAESDSESIADMISEFRNAIKEMPIGQQDGSGLSELTNMISELIREQRTANDSLQKIYQASVN